MMSLVHMGISVTKYHAGLDNEDKKAESGRLYI